MPIMECHDIPQTKQVLHSFEPSDKPSTGSISFTTGTQPPLEQNTEEI